MQSKEIYDKINKNLLYIFFYMKKIQNFLIICIAVLAISTPEVFAVAANEIEKSKENANMILSFFSADMFINFFFAVIIIILTFLSSKIITAKLVYYLENNYAGEASGREELVWVISRTVNITILLIGFSLTLGVLWIDMWIFMGWIWFGIGYTLRTFLTNFVSGIIMVTQGFYKNGDIIGIDDKMGKIVKVNALFTAVEQFDGVIFYVPNITFLEQSVTNYHTNDKRRVEIHVNVGYEEDIVKAKMLLMKVFESFPNVLQAPHADVIVDDLGDNGVLLKARYWMSVTDDYFALKSNLTETINLAFRQQWIDIPYPQMTLSHKHWDAADLK